MILTLYKRKNIDPRDEWKGETSKAEIIGAETKGREKAPSHGKKNDESIS